MRYGQTMKNSIKILLMLLCVLAILVAVPACNKEGDTPDDTTTENGGTTTNPPGTEKVTLSLNETNLVIGIGETKKLSAKSSLTNMETSGVLWISDNPSVATVDTSGNVKGISDGTAIITVSTIDGSSEAKCAVTVTSRVTGVNIVENEIVLEVGTKTDLEYHIIPENAANKGVTWTSNNKAVATVSENGVITAIADGAASIQIKTDDGGITDICTVTVITPVKGISFNQTVWNVTKGITFEAPYTITPANATNKNVTWSSNNESVAIVDGNGKVIAIGAGSATITVTASNGCYAQCIVNVKASVTGVTISHKEIVLKRGEEWTLTAEVLPADASVRDVTWRTSDATKATVTQSGIVLAKSTGEVVISVVTADGYKTAECKVIIINPLTSIVLDKASLTLSTYDSPVSLVPTFEPIDAENIAEARWSSNNTKVATVDQSGTVTPVGPGTAVITISTDDGVFASCTVTVSDSSKPVSSITVATRFVTIKVGQKHTPIVTVLPDDAGDKSYVLTTNSTIVRIEEDGSIIALSKGTAIITVSSVMNPEINQEIIVYVEELTQDEIDAEIIKYNSAMEQEKNRHIAALATIDSHYAYLADLKAKLDTEYADFDEGVYKAQKTLIENTIADYQTDLSEAENASNMELVNLYTTLIAAEQAKLSQLEDKWSTYSTQLQIYNEENEIYQSEVSAENKQNTDNIDSINREYEYILPYLPAV